MQCSRRAQKFVYVIFPMALLRPCSQLSMRAFSMLFVSRDTAGKFAYHFCGPRFCVAEHRNFFLLSCFGDMPFFFTSKTARASDIALSLRNKKNARKLFRFICRVNQGLSNALFGFSGGWCLAAMWACPVHGRVLEWFHHTTGEGQGATDMWCR